MGFGRALFYTLKLLLLNIILVELSVVRMIIMPSSFYEYIVTAYSIGVYIEHIILSIVFWSLGALIYLKRG